MLSSPHVLHSTNSPNLPGLWAGILILIFIFKIHKLIPLPSSPQPNVFPIKAAVCGLQLQSWCVDFYFFIFGKQSQCLIPFGLLLRTQLLSECINISFNSCSRRSAPISLLEVIFYRTGTPSFGFEGFLLFSHFTK